MLAALNMAEIGNFAAEDKVLKNSRSSEQGLS